MSHVLTKLLQLNRCAYNCALHPHKIFHVLSFYLGVWQNSLVGLIQPPEHTTLPESSLDTIPPISFEHFKSPKLSVAQCPGAQTTPAGVLTAVPPPAGAQNTLRNSSSAQPLLFASTTVDTIVKSIIKITLLISFSFEKSQTPSELLPEPPRNTKTHALPG